MRSVCVNNIVWANNPYIFYVAGNHRETGKLRILRRGRFSSPLEPGHTFSRCAYWAKYAFDLLLLWAAGSVRGAKRLFATGELVKSRVLKLIRHMTQVTLSLNGGGCYAV